MDEINKKIKDLESQIAKRCSKDRDIYLLKSIPGVGTFTAFLVKSEIIDDIARFSSKKKLCSYADLVPSTYSSGERLYHGRIIKQGNKFLRWALTEAAQTSVRCSEYFRYHYSRIRSRKNANSATIAIVRRMLEIIYAILKEDREYIEKAVNIK
jgi:transposase